MPFRSDLAAEAVESAAGQPLSERDVRQKQIRDGDMTVTTIHIDSDRAEQVLGKPRGTYVTAQFPTLTDHGGAMEDTACRLATYLEALLPQTGPVVVAGLGNERITPDALGPKVASMVLATRHIRGEFARAAGLSDLRPTAVIAPGVLGQTGVEAGEIVRGVCSAVHPAAVIAVDALACRDLGRLGRTVQIADTGIAPGSGVGNHRAALSADTLGVPVIAVGVPTVVDAATIAMELTGQEDGDPFPAGHAMMVTPREIDLLIDRASRLVAMTINRLLQPDYSPLELIALAE
ncbi:MAG: GPR endopeptidase [Acutalibacteraceae bacterium]|jgi:spore protease